MLRQCFLANRLRIVENMKGKNSITCGIESREFKFAI